eukprot:Em0013g906a
MIITSLFKSFIITKNTLDIVQVLSVKLQKRDQDVLEAYAIVDEVMKTLESTRKTIDTGFAACAEAERSFSLMKRIKTCTISIMTEQRLSDLAIIAVHYSERIPVEETGGLLPVLLVFSLYSPLGVPSPQLLALSSSSVNVMQFNPTVPNGIITAYNVRQRSTALWKQHAPQLDVRLVVLPMSQHWIVVLQSSPQALHSSWNMVLGVISAAASLPSMRRTALLGPPDPESDTDDIVISVFINQIINPDKSFGSSDPMCILPLQLSSLLVEHTAPNIHDSTQVLLFMLALGPDYYHKTHKGSPRPYGGAYSHSPVPQLEQDVARARYKADPEKKKASVRDTYKADPEKKKASVRDTYKADPEKKKASVRDTYNANVVSKRAAKRQRYQEGVEENRAAKRQRYQEGVEENRAAKRQRYQEGVEENRAANRRIYRGNSATIKAARRSRYWKGRRTTTTTQRCTVRLPSSLLVAAALPPPPAAAELPPPPPPAAESCPHRQQQQSYPRGSGIAGVTELPLPPKVAAELPPPPPAVAAELPPPPPAVAAELPPPPPAVAAELPPTATSSSSRAAPTATSSSSRAAPTATSSSSRAAPTATSSSSRAAPTATSSSSRAATSSSSRAAATSSSSRAAATSRGRSIATCTSPTTGTSSIDTSAPTTTSPAAPLAAATTTHMAPMARTRPLRP